MTSPALALDNDNATLVRLLHRLRGSTRADYPSAETPMMEAVLDDLEAVLGEHADLTDDEVRLLCIRLRHIFLKFLTMASQIIPSLSRELTMRALSLASEQPPWDDVSALGYLRRLAITVQDLMEHFMGYARHIP